MVGPPEKNVREKNKNKGTEDGNGYIDRNRNRKKTNDIK
jgi:hypothetical protein